MTEEGKRAIQAIVNVFETGRAAGDYAAATILRDGAGISYGRSQATDAGGNLDAIVHRYFDLGGRYAPQLAPFVPRLAANETARVDPASPPDWCRELLRLLRAAGSEDETMRRAQDQIFDEAYWVPAVQHCESMRLVHALSWAIVYDTCIHSGPGGVPRMRARFAEVPPSRGGEEKGWAKAYVKARREWLASSPNALVRKTTYRMDTFDQLISQDRWELTVPFTVRGVRIT